MLWMMTIQPYELVRLYGGVQKLPASQNRQCLAIASHSDMAPTGGKKRRLLDFLATGKIPRRGEMMRQLLPIIISRSWKFSHT
mgnify:CR=1 FL=1